jgi:hypothetical protein
MEDWYFSGAAPIFSTFGFYAADNPTDRAVNYSMVIWRVVRSHHAIFPERHKALVADRIFVHRKRIDHFTQRPSVLLGPLAANDAIVSQDHRAVQ